MFQGTDRAVEVLYFAVFVQGDSQGFLCRVAAAQEGTGVWDKAFAFHFGGGIYPSEGGDSLGIGGALIRLPEQRDQIRFRRFAFLDLGNLRIVKIGAGGGAAGKHEAQYSDKRRETERLSNIFHDYLILETELGCG